MISGHKRNTVKIFIYEVLHIKSQPKKMKERKNSQNKYCATKWGNVHCIGLNLAPRKSLSEF